MAGYEAFLACVFRQAEAKGFGEKRAQEIADRFTGLTERYLAAGHAAPEEMAMRQVFGELHAQQAAKAKLAQTRLEKTAEFKDLLSGNQTVEGATFGGVSGFLGTMNKDAQAGHRVGRLAVSTIERDPRVKGSNYSALQATYRGQLWAIGSDILEHISKGLFGVQRGAAHLPNVVREIFGEGTGDAAAKDIATAWRKMSDAGVDMFNQAGGAMQRLSDWNLPQAQSQADLLKHSAEDWISDHGRWLDWSKMAWPDGSPIKPEEREAVLRQVHRTLSTGGIDKITPESFGGRGSAVGNAMEEHRFLRYKDGTSWLEMHEKYGGGGSVFDVMARHIDGIAHRIALVKQFGPNPDLGAEQLKRMTLKQAEAEGGVRGLAEAEAVLKNKFDPMFAIVTHKNMMDPESTLAFGVNTTANVLVAAQLGSASLAAIPGDAATASFMTLFNKAGLRPFSFVEKYLGTFLTDRTESVQMATQAGLILDGVISSHYAASRFTGATQYGAAVSSRVSDTVMRASGMNGHTESMRFAVQMELMGAWARDAGKSFDQLPYADMLGRYGVGPAEWDAFRAMPAYEHPSGARFLRPVDLVGSGGGNADSLFRMFQGLLLDEGKFAVPDATFEARATLRGTTRPDTVPGAVLHSFSMYKNLPVTMIQMYGRLAMVNPNVTGRLQTVAGLAALLTMSGALAIQMREVAKGRDPLPMDTPAFLGKAILAGGAAGVMGDFLFSHVNRFGAGPEETIAGPLVGFAGDSVNLVFGDAFKWAEAFGSLDQGNPGELKTPARAVEFAKRYTPGTNIWWARLALERQFFDRMQELADPKAYQSWNNRVRKQRREQGNEYYWTPGSPAPDRAPSARGLFGQ